MSGVELVQPAAAEVEALLAKELDPDLLRAQYFGAVMGALDIFVRDVRHDLEYAADLRASVALSLAEAEARYAKTRGLYEAAIAVAAGQAVTL